MSVKAFWDLVRNLPAAPGRFKALVSKYPSSLTFSISMERSWAARYPEQCAPEFLRELILRPTSCRPDSMDLRNPIEENLDEALKFARRGRAFEP